jgi:hypothetical protein
MLKNPACRIYASDETVVAGAEKKALNQRDRRKGIPP